MTILIFYSGKQHLHLCVYVYLYVYIVYVNIDVRGACDIVFVLMCISSGDCFLSFDLEKWNVYKSSDPWGFAKHLKSYDLRKKVFKRMQRGKQISSINLFRQVFSACAVCNRRWIKGQRCSTKGDCMWKQLATELFFPEKYERKEMVEKMTPVL